MPVKFHCFKEFSKLRPCRLLRICLDTNKYIDFESLLCVSLQSTPPPFHVSIFPLRQWTENFPDGMVTDITKTRTEYRWPKSYTFSTGNNWFVFVSHIFPSFLFIPGEAITQHLFTVNWAPVTIHTLSVSIGLQLDSQDRTEVVVKIHGAITNNSNIFVPLGKITETFDTYAHFNLQIIQVNLKIHFIMRWST